MAKDLPSSSANVATKAAPAKAPAAPAKPAAAMAKPAAVRPAAPAATAPAQQAMAAKANQAQQQQEDEEEEEEEGGQGVSKSFLFNTVPSVFVSSVVHALFVIILALVTFSNDTDKKKYEIVAKNFEQAEEIMEFKDNLVQQPVDVNAAVSTEMTAPTALSSEVVIDTDISPAADLDAAAIQVELSDFGEQTAPRNDLAKSIGAFTGSGLDGRGAASRKAMVAAGGGSEASEAAVAAALKWFAEHQFPDGSWSFDHTKGPCQGKCSQPGKLENGRNSATGMALLPFLGSGQTHKEGAYKEKVRGGLYFLVQNMKSNNQGGATLADGGSMYGHGICSIVLCEAYAMTHDRELMAPAQAVINHIVYAQDPVGGGWRYAPRQPGDTSAVGWQLMALKSAHMAYLQVPPQTIANAVKFLDSVQSDSGSKYGYTGPGAGLATTSVGLLSRMYLGWKKENPALQRGVEFLAKTGPSKGNLYYSYYATQIMRHNEGEEWKKWNAVMRDSLVDSQEKSGHQKGSWFTGAGDHGADRGGRHYCTSMSTMILEVYYRHMPIYRKAASEEDFPL